MLTVAAIFPKVFIREIAGKSVRAAGALDRGVGSYVKVDLMRRAVDPNRAWGE